MLSSFAGFLPESFTYSVHPDLWVLSAVEELVSGSRLDKIGEAVSMLEYLHSHYRDLPEERDYINLIVDTCRYMYKINVQGTCTKLMY